MEDPLLYSDPNAMDLSREGISRQMSLSKRDYGQWLQIQRNTFTNWVNEGLRPRGIVIEDIRTDLSDGVNLVALVEALIGHKVSGAVARPSNQYQKLQNITVAIDAVKNDGVKIVNIDSSDIMEGNLKLVLALIWQLVLKYQVGLKSAQSKAWILKWLRAVIPDCKVNNFTTDWNDGIALHALLDFCKPGISPNWRQLDKNDKLENCRSAMNLARQHFNIPLVLRPEDLASPDLDEKSAITYLSYFIKVGGPGYDATLQRVTSRTQPKTVTNFNTDWQDGQALVNLVRSAGGQIQDVDRNSENSQDRIKAALQAAKDIGVEPLLSPTEITASTTEHLGMMAYSAQFIPYRNTYISYNDTNNNVSDTRHLSVSNNALDSTGHTDVKQPVHVTTIYNNNNYNNGHDDSYSTAPASTITSLASTEPPKFHLVRKSSIHAPRVEAPPLDQLKVDIYSVGVIMESKMVGAFDPEKFKVEAVAPTGRVIKIHGDGQYAAQFTADEIGRWKVSMYYDGRYMDGCPIDVCDPSQVRVKELKGGHVSKQNHFFVDCTRAGQGDLGVDVTHRGRNIPTFIHKSSGTGYYDVSFTPYEAGPYEINVHFNRAEIRETEHHRFDPEDRSRKAVFLTRVEPKDGYVEVRASCDWEVDYITGGPFICHVTDSTDIAVYGMDDGTVCAYPTLIADATTVGEGRIDADVTFNGIRYPCKVRKDRRPCMYQVSFKPKGPGIYKVWIKYDGQPVKGSPFIQQIEELAKPSAHGDGLYRGMPGKPATFTIDPRGFPGQVSVAVNGPTKPVNSQLDPQPDHTIKATYYPTERGPHRVHVKLDNKDIEGSPYNPLIVDPVNVRVSGGWRPYLDEKGIIPLRVHKEKHLPFDVTEAGPGELNAEVQGPNGKIPVTIDARNDGKQTVVFTPREEGKHYIHVNWGGYPLTNSPYLGYATHEPELDEPYPNVRLVHVPLQPQPQPQPVLIDRYPSPRSSMVGSVVDGPVVSIIGSEPDPYRPHEVIYRPDHPTRVQVLPTSSGAYPPDSMDGRYPNSLSPHSPRSTTSPTGPQKVVLSGKGLKEAEVNKPAQFQVDGTKANPGRPVSHLEDVRHNALPVTAEPVRPQVFKCNYTPQKPGAYLLYINWNDKPLKGSPFKVAVREPAQPKKVTAQGNPASAVIGKDLEMKIDPRSAGPGKLTVKCTDPLRKDVPCKLTDNFDGTRSLRMTPRMPGQHVVEIRYNGDHIMGSPYAIHIKETNSRQVRVWGPGIENGIIPNFQSTFWVETTGAGAGDLRVRIIGPKGAFKVKMRKASQREKIYQCLYDPEEAGVYTVSVEWSGVHVEGSPFTVILAYNARDLQRMQEELQAANDTTNRSFLNGGENDSEIALRSSRIAGGSSRNSPRDRSSSNVNDFLY